MGKDLGAHENLQFPDNPIELATITFVNPNRPIGDNLIFEEFQSPSYHPDKPETYWHRLIHHPNIIIGGDTLPFERETYITNEPQTPMEVKNVIRIVLLGTQGADKQQYQDTFFERRDRHPNPQLN